METITNMFHNLYSSLDTISFLNQVSDGMRMWTLLAWLRISSSGEFFEYGYTRLPSIKAKNFSTN
jgi:hypothetical protein